MQFIEQEKYVEFHIGGEQYAIRIQEIHEIIKMQTITPIPSAVSYVKGVIHLRGKVVPIISLRSLFRLQDKEASKTTRIMVVHHQEGTVGIIVDSVNKVTTFEDVQPPPDHFGHVNGSLLVGIGITGGDLVGVLKLDKVLLQDEEVKRHQVFTR